MKKIKSFISAATVAAAVIGAVPLASGAEEVDGLIYGTMNIPYADFYRAELSGSANAYEVDAVSSATTSKWSKNGEGELFEGTYNEANSDGTGTILGVTYPVAITREALDVLGENNYGFTEITEIPSAYKSVTVEDGKAVFSAVQDDTPATASGASIKLSTNTPWGDYLIDVENKPEFGAIYGALLRTTDGNAYAMCHESNIWRGELAWSSGIKTSEPHGNTLPYENFTGLMGATISEVVFITSEGYTTIETSTYVPVKFAGEISVAESVSGTGKTTFVTSGFPDDYEKNYSIADNFTVTDSEISYTDALAGAYTLTISDAGGKYADMTSDFVLTTESMPAKYSDGSIVKSDDSDETDFANYIKNISAVSVNGTSYSSSGKGSVRIIDENGKINTEASSRKGKVFDGNGTYHLTVTAKGYKNNLEFDLTIGGTETDTPATATTAPSVDNDSTTTTTTTAKAAAANSKTTAAKKNNSSGKSDKSDSPKTGVAGVAVPLTAMTAAAALAFVSKNKNKF